MPNYFSFRSENGGQAFAPIDTVLDTMAFEKIGILPAGLPYSFYQQFYHIRFASQTFLSTAAMMTTKPSIGPMTTGPKKKGRTMKMSGIA